MSVKQLFDLSGRVALITGASRGLGLAMAAGLAEMGARVALTARKADGLQAARARLLEQGIEAFTLVNDLSRIDTVQPMVDAVCATLGPIDILVNNAGVSWGAPAEEHPLAAWDKLIQLNLTGTFAVTQCVALQSMIPRRQGRIINIASIAGLRGSQQLQAAAYHASKGGLVNLTRALAAEWGHYGITVNAICPGFIPSKMTQVALDRIAASVIAATPLGRLGVPEDLQGLAVLLASDAGRHISGQAIAVDGGMMAA